MESYTTATATAVPGVTASDEHQVAVVPIVTSEEMSRHVKTVLREYTKDRNNGSTLSLQDDHCNQHYTSGISVVVPVRKGSSTRTGLTTTASTRTIKIIDYKPITFDHPTQFSIKNNWYNKSDCERKYCPTTLIMGGPKNSNEVMFSVTRFGEGGKLVIFKDIRELPNHEKDRIMNEKFESKDTKDLLPSLLMRNQKNYYGGHKVELCHIVDQLGPDPETTAVPICTVVRRFCNYSIRDLYTVELVGPSSTKNNDSYLDCKGQLPKKMTLSNENKDGGKFKLATLQKKLFHSHWKVNVSQGVDVLLHIAITCAIDRIRQGFECGCI